MKLQCEDILLNLSLEQNARQIQRNCLRLYKIFEVLACRRSKTPHFLESNPYSISEITVF